MRHQCARVMLLRMQVAHPHMIVQSSLTRIHCERSAKKLLQYPKKHNRQTSNPSTQEVPIYKRTHFTAHWQHPATPEQPNATWKHACTYASSFALEWHNGKGRGRIREGLLLVLL